MENLRNENLEEKIRKLSKDNEEMKKNLGTLKDAQNNRRKEIWMDLLNERRHIFSEVRKSMIKKNCESQGGQKNHDGTSHPAHDYSPSAPGRIYPDLGAMTSASTAPVIVIGWNFKKSSADKSCPEAHKPHFKKEKKKKLEDYLMFVAVVNLILVFGSFIYIYGPFENV